MQRRGRRKALFFFCEGRSDEEKEKEEKRMHRGGTGCGRTANGGAKGRVGWGGGELGMPGAVGAQREREEATNPRGEGAMSLFPFRK